MYIFDAHSDIWMKTVSERRIGNPNYFIKTHYPKLKKGMVGGAIFVVFTETDKEIDPIPYFWREVGGVCLEISEIEKLDAPITFVKSYGEIEEAKNKGKIFALMGIEGLSGIGDDIYQLYTLYRLGFRHASLTWNEENSFAAGASVEDPSKGITPIGEKAIKLIEELGMILDVSHLNEKSFWDVVDIAKKPFIASHSNSKSLCQHRRNITDEQAKAIAKSDGVIGVNACKEFLHENSPSLKYFVDHIEYLVNITGIESVGIGFDFCDFLRTEGEKPNDNYFKKNVDGLRNVTEASSVLKELKSRGFADSDIEKIAYRNFLRVIKEIIL